MGASDENRLAELRRWLQEEESWAAGKLMPSDLAFVIRLLDEAHSEFENLKRTVQKLFIRK